MTYNTTKRVRMSAKGREAFLLAHNGICYWCVTPILPGMVWHVEHRLARELGGVDEPSNLAPIHADCHKEKSANDAKLIAKSNRIRRANGPPEQRRQPKHKIKGRGFEKGKSRPIPQRAKPWS